MDIQQIIELYQPGIIQIATQGGTGTGFYIEEFDLIVTNDHVIETNPEVTIAGKTFLKTFSRVWYTDRKHDLAFLEPPKNARMPELKLGKYENIHDGDEVLAIGHPYGLNYTATQGVISKADRIRDGLNISIDGMNRGDAWVINNLGSISQGGREVDDISPTPKNAADNWWVLDNQDCGGLGADVVPRACDFNNRGIQGNQGHRVWIR